MEVIAGEQQFETEVSQHGVRFRLDFSKVRASSSMGCAEMGLQFVTAIFTADLACSTVLYGGTNNQGHADLFAYCDVTSTNVILL